MIPTGHPPQWCGTRSELLVRVMTRTLEGFTIGLTSVPTVVCHVTARPARKVRRVVTRLGSLFSSGCHPLVLRW